MGHSFAIKNERREDRTLNQWQKGQCSTVGLITSFASNPDHARETLIMFKDFDILIKPGN